MPDTRGEYDEYRVDHEGGYVRRSRISNLDQALAFRTDILPTSTFFKASGRGEGKQELKDHSGCLISLPARRREFLRLGIAPLHRELADVRITGRTIRRVGIESTPAAPSMQKRTQRRICGAVVAGPSH